MNRKLNIHRVYLSFILVCCILFFNSGCFKGTGFPGVSSSIDESIKREVFIDSVQFRILNPDTSIINIIPETGWLEHHWKYGDQYRETTVFPGYQLRIKFSEDSPESFFKTLKGIQGNYTINGNDSIRFRPTSSYSMVADLDNIGLDSLQVEYSEYEYEENQRTKVLSEELFIVYFLE